MQMTVTKDNKCKIFAPASRQYLMWAEPDEGSYNWKLFDIGSRYDHNEIKIPDDILEYVRENSSKYYPVIIIDGFHLDSLLDIRDSNSAHIKHYNIGRK